MVTMKKRILLFLSMLFVVLINSFAVSPKGDDNEEDSLLNVQWDSLNLIKATLVKSKTSLEHFANDAKGKISNYSNEKVKLKESIASLSKDSIAIPQLQDSLNNLQKRLKSYNPYRKFAEQCAIKYANNKLYYPYDNSVENALDVLIKIKDNPYPQLLDILQNYKGYYKGFLFALEEIQNQPGAKAVSAKHNNISSQMMSELRNKYADGYIRHLMQTEYCTSKYYKTSNSIHYMDVLIKEFYNAIAKYKAGQKDLIFNDYVEFGRLFNFDR